MSATRLAYRPDIDGLRAIAVACVIVFHLFPSSLRGGFIGVDIFFVISGFLITSIIDQEVRGGCFSFRRFYVRRMRRILPAFFVVTFATLVAGYYILLPPAYRELAISAIAATCYIANWHFASLKSYFSQDVQEYPLLNTWSLSVEEQYYAVWPLLFVFLSGKRIPPVAQYAAIIGVLVLSFVLACVYSVQSPTFAYYSIATRAFELLIGSALAFALMRGCGRPASLSIFAGWSSIFLEMTAFTGLVLIGLSAIWLGGGEPFPGIYALPPTLGCALLLYATHFKPRSLCGRILSIPVLVKTGKLSYSLYLWHWPLLAFWRYLNPGTDLNASDGMTLVALCVLLSAATYRWVESPFRRQRSTGFLRVWTTYQVMPAAFLLLMAYHVKVGAGLPNRLSERSRAEASYVWGMYCFGSRVADCVFGDTDRRPIRVLLFGDSHVAHVSPLWDRVGKELGFSLRILSEGACYPVIDTPHSKPSINDDLYDPSACKAQIEEISQTYQEYDLIMLGGVWNNYLNAHYKNGLSFPAALSETLDILRDAGKKVIVLGDIPFHRGLGVTRAIRRAHVPLLVGHSHTLISLDDNSEANTRIRSLTASYANVRYFDTNAEVIALAPSFPYSDAGTLLLYDGTHLNLSGIRELAEKFIESGRLQQFRNVLQTLGLAELMKRS